MPAFGWPSNPMSAASGLHNDATAYLLCATWAVDALYYLDDLDHGAERLPWTDLGHHTDTVALAHARWAASTAIPHSTCRPLPSASTTASH